MIWSPLYPSKNTSALMSVRFICFYQKKKITKLSLKEMGIPDHLTCLLRNLYAGQEATLRTGHGTTDWFQIGKGCILSPYLFNLMQSTS